MRHYSLQHTMTATTHCSIFSLAKWHLVWQPCNNLHMPKRIMIIDDSITIRKLAAVTLQAAGYEIYEANDGQIALGNVLAFAPHMIISDVNMPNVNGFQFVSSIRNDAAYAAIRFIPIVMLTTEGEQEKKAEGRSAGATAWMVKPFLPEAMLAVTEKLIGRP